MNVGKFALTRDDLTDYKDSKDLLSPRTSSLGKKATVDGSGAVGGPPSIYNNIFN